MLYRVLILLILAILAGCGQQAETADTKTKPVQTSAEPPVSFKTYSVMDSANLEKFFDDRNALFSKKISKILDDVEHLFEKRNSSDKLDGGKQIYYKVCYSDIDGFTVRHPCSLDSALLVNVVKKMNGEDSLKGLRFKLQSISYAQSVIEDFPTMSKIILNEDGSLEATCASKEGKTCNHLYAQVVVSKKFSIERFLEEEGSTWVPESYYVSIDENNFAKDFEMALLLASIFERSLKHFYRGNEVDSLIPFEMCYENGFAVPCGLSPKERDIVKKTVENYGDTLIAVTYQKSLTMNAFAYDGMTSKHFCKSQDGIHCSELYALVREKNEELEKFCKMLEEKNEKHTCAGAMDLCYAVGSRMALYRFSTKDLYVAKEELSHGDIMPSSDGMLYKKDGTYLGFEKTHR